MKMSNRCNAIRFSRRLARACALVVGTAVFAVPAILRAAETETPVVSEAVWSPDVSLNAKIDSGTVATDEVQSIYYDAAWQSLVPEAQARIRISIRKNSPGAAETILFDKTGPNKGSVSWDPSGQNDGRYIIKYELLDSAGTVLETTTRVFSVLEGSQVSEVVWSPDVSVNAKIDSGTVATDGVQTIYYDTAWLSLVPEAQARIRISIRKDSPGAAETILFDKTGPNKGSVSWDPSGQNDGRYIIKYELLDSAGAVLETTTSTLNVSYNDANFAEVSGISLNAKAGTEALFASDVEILAFSPEWTTPPAAKTRITVTPRHGAAEILYTSENNIVGEYAWATSPLPENRYTLTHEFIDAVGHVTTTAPFTAQMLVYRSAVLHAGRLTASETWSAGKVHIVTGTIIVPAGVTLNIESGAIVKFVNGAGIVVESGGILNVTGATLTHFADDTAGGDSNMDGTETRPVADQWTISGAGSINIDDATQECWRSKTVATGTLATDQTWRGGRTYIIEGDLTIPSGKILNIQAGAIIKFFAGKRIAVASGGSLKAVGRSDNKIIFTSIKDDIYGGDISGDGNASQPNPGDWKGIINDGGTVEINHAGIFYGGYGEYSNRSDAALRNNSGTLTVRNSELFASLLRHVYAAGTVRIENTILRDARWAVDGKADLVNCVIYGCENSLSGSGCTAKNTIVSSCTNSPSGYTFANSILWRAGSVANAKVADPLFRDPEHGDFTLRAGSPCIDAGDGMAAPARDYFGQERADDLHAANTGTPSANGACPDIGIYEMSANAVSEVDLLVESITVPVSAQVGANITVSHSIANIGSKAAKGICTSDLSWVSATSGATVKASTATTALDLAPGGQVVVSQTLAIPALADGDWRLRVQVNVNRAISEGQNTGNNTRDAANLTAITMPALTGRTEDFTVGAGRERSFKVEASASADNVVLIQAVEGLKIYGGHGYVPSGGGHDSTAVYVGNGLYALTLPQGTGAVFVTVENASTTAQSLTIEQTAATLRLFDTSLAQLPKTGQATFTLYGTGFTQSTGVSLKQGAVVLIPASVRLASASELVVTVAIQDAVAGTYDIVASGGGASATLPGALTVPGTPPKGPKLEAKLEVPDAIRAGRINTGWISYANTGDTDMLMPLFTIKASAQTQMTDRLDGEFGSEPVYLAGVGGSYPAGVLKAGESGRVSFFFKVVGDGAAQFTLTHSQEGDGAAPYPQFSSRRDYFESLSVTATRFALLGRIEARINELTDYELTRRAGVPVAGIAGMVQNSQNKEAMSGVTVFVVRGGETVRSAVTDENGFFLLEQLADGAYSFLVDGASLVSAPSVVTVAGQKDVGGTAITAAPWRTVSGRVRVAVTGTGVSGQPVKLVEKGGWTGTAVTDASGGFLFQNVVEGTYDVIAESAGGYVGDSVSAVTLTEGTFSQNVELEMTPGGIVTGVVTWNGGQANEGRVSAILADGRTVETVCAEDGSYSFGGLPEASYTFQYAADEWLSGETAVTVTKGGTQVVNLDAKPRPLFFPERPLGFGSLTTNFRFADTKRRDSVQTWKWDFDSDGTIDSTEGYPEHTYSQTGSYTVTLEITEAGGTTTASRYENCVTVMDTIPNILNANAFIVSDVPGLVCEELTDTSLVIKGTPPLTITQGTVIMAAKDGSTVIRKVKTVVKNGDLWSLETEDADFDALYESYSFSSFGEATEVVSPAPLTRSIARAAAATSTSGPITVKGGLIGSIEARPKLRPDFVSWKRNGVSYMRIAVIADIEAEITLGINGEISGGFEKTYEMKLACPTTVPGLTIGPKFEYGFEGSLTGSAKATLCTYTMNPTVVMGIERINGKTKPLKSPPKFAGTLQGPEGSLGLNGSVKGFFKIQAETEWCKLVRASLGAELSDEISIETKTNAPLKIENKVELAITAELGVGLEINNFELLGPRATFELPWTLADNKWESPMPVIDYLPSSSTNYANGGWVAPATINFKDKSAPGSNTTSVSFLGSSRVTYPIEEYKWDLGILSSPLKDPQCTYTKDGAYKVTLKVKGGPITSMLSTAEHTIQVGKKKEPPKPDKHDDDKKSDQKRSQDPNEMAGPAGVGALRYVQPGEWLSFRVYFENKSDAAAAAQEVWVTNMLSSSLDWGSFELQEVVFANQVELGLNGKKTGSIEVAQRGTSTRVRVEASLDALTGKVVWYMRSVDPASADSWPADPYAGFLAPNNETGRGEGYVAYRVKVRADAPYSTRIDSSAEIIFDYNDPIITNPAWFNTVSAAPVFTTQPQPRSVTAGVNVTFTAVASGYPMPTYQWYKDGVALSGQTSSTLTLTKVQVGNTGSYTVRATNAVAPSGVSSNAATLTVNGPKAPKIVVQQPAGTGLKNRCARSFGTVALKSTVTKTFTIQNTGTANLTHLSVSRSGKNAKDFIVKAPLKTTLAPGAKTTFKVIFKPTAQGARKALLRIRSNDKKNDPFEIALTGKGGSKGKSAVVKSARLPSWRDLTTSGDGNRSHQTTGTTTLADGRKYLTITASKTPGAFLPGRRVEVSPNLIDWYSGSKHTTILVDDAFLLKVRDNVPLTPENKRYIRMKAN